MSTSVSLHVTFWKLCRGKEIKRKEKQTLYVIFLCTCFSLGHGKASPSEESQVQKSVGK
jgi:hypothetical protein